MDSVTRLVPQTQPGPPPARLEGLTTAAEGWGSAGVLTPGDLRWPGWFHSILCPWVPGHPGLGSAAPCAPGSLGALAWAPQLRVSLGPWAPWPGLRGSMAGVGSTRAPLWSTQTLLRGVPPVSLEVTRCVLSSHDPGGHRGRARGRRVSSEEVGERADCGLPHPALPEC